MYNCHMGTLYIVSTPIGNLGDITLRAIETLKKVTVVACEDTRRAGQLYAYLNCPAPRLIRYDNYTEIQAAPELIALMSEGKNVALISDAGTPLLSDPGYVLVFEARKRGIPVTAVPGASALLAALTSSGVPTDKFVFLGYPPEKHLQRLKLFRHLIPINRLIGMTYVLYCAPHKLTEVLTDMRQEFGDIELVICRELTKIHEQYWRGNIVDATNHFSDPKGEFVLLFRLMPSHQ